MNKNSGERTDFLRYKYSAHAPFGRCHSSDTVAYISTCVLNRMKLIWKLASGEQEPVQVSIKNCDNFAAF